MIGTAVEERPKITSDLLAGAASALSDTAPLLRDKKVLMIGAGGIGCELLKNLVLAGFTDITVVDMDTIELSNLNRQFLFTKHDIGGYKAEVACRAVERLYPGLRVRLTPRVCNVKTMSVADFCHFSVVLSALDNLEARRHVNEQAVMADVPVVESGTAGYQGQVGMWRRGRECFDCRHHSPPTTFPVCTIRATPTLMIHCIVWAKEYLLARLFGDSSEGDQRMEEIEDATIRAALIKEERAFDDIKQEEDDRQFANLLCHKLYKQDVEETLRNVEMWKEKEVKPTPLSSLDTASVDIESERMSEWSTAQWLHCLQETAIALRNRRQSSLFDKDDDTVMAFVAAAANLRAATYNCQPATVSLFKAKEMAGNIIPAVATANAIAAALACLLAVNCFRVGGVVGNVYITHGAKGRLLTKEALQEGELECAVCNSTRVHVRCRLDLCVSELLRALGVTGDVMVLHKGRLVYDSLDMAEAVAERALHSFDIHYGDIITISGDQDVLVALFEGDLLETRVINTALPKPPLADTAVDASKKREREDDDEPTEAKAVRIEEDLLIIS